MESIKIHDYTVKCAITLLLKCFVRDLDLAHQCANRELIVVHLATREVGAVADEAEKKKRPSIHTLKPATTLLP